MPARGSSSSPSSVVFNASDFSVCPRERRQLHYQVISFSKLLWWFYLGLVIEAIKFLVAGSLSAKWKVWLCQTGDLCHYSHRGPHMPTVMFLIDLSPLNRLILDLISLWSCKKVYTRGPEGKESHLSVCYLGNWKYFMELRHRVNWFPVMSGSKVTGEIMLEVGGELPLRLNEQKLLSRAGRRVGVQVRYSVEMSVQAPYSLAFLVTLSLPL